MWHFTSHPKFHVWQNSNSWVIAQGVITTGQIAQFLKVQYLKNELRYEVVFAYVSNRYIGLRLTRLGMPWVLQSYKSGTYSKEKIRSSFLWRLDSLNKRSYEITVVCPSLTASVGQSNIFGTSRWPVFSDFSINLIVLTSKNLQLNFYRNFIFAPIWIKKPPKGALCFCFFKKFFCNLVFLKKKVWKENYCNSWLQIRISTSWKVLGLDLLSKMLSTNQIAGFQ